MPSSKPQTQTRLHTPFASPSSLATAAAKSSFDAASRKSSAMQNSYCPTPRGRSVSTTAPPSSFAMKRGGGRNAVSSEAERARAGSFSNAGAATTGCAVERKTQRSTSATASRIPVRSGSGPASASRARPATPSNFALAVESGSEYGADGGDRNWERRTYYDNTATPTRAGKEREHASPPTSWRSYNLPNSSSERLPFAHSDLLLDDFYNISPHNHIAFSSSSRKSALSNTSSIHANTPPTSAGSPEHKPQDMTLAEAEIQEETTRLELEHWKAHMAAETLRRRSQIISSRRPSTPFLPPVPLPLPLRCRRQSGVEPDGRVAGCVGERDRGWERNGEVEVKVGEVDIERLIGEVEGLVGEILGAGG